MKRRWHLFAHWLAVAGVSVVVLSAARAADAASPSNTGLLEPQIAVVWPHNGQGNPTSVANSRAVNVSVWPRNQVDCSLPDTAPPPLVVLGVAQDNEPLKLVSEPPYSFLRLAGGARFPAFEFNNIPADLATNPASKYAFVVIGGMVVGGPGAKGNVWVHAADPRTYLPQPVVPTDYSTLPLPALDLRIQVVFPHDAQGAFAPVESASLVNVAVDLFEQGTTKSVPLDFPPPDSAIRPYLLVAEGNNPLIRTDIAPRKETYTVNNQTYPRWVFNDVPVVPGRQYRFLADISGRFAYHSEASTVWIHAADARTILPHPEPPLSCIP